MSVYDAFVDAGKAATSLDDQIATIKIIREIRGRPFDVREGSVVPDLSNPRFRPRNLPPVPRFSDTIRNLGKRSRDDAFREETSNREGSQGSSSTRRRRLHALKESGATERLVPSIEREVHEPTWGASRCRPRQESPIVIPETQESPLRHGMNPRQGGSEILGEEEPKSESLEVGNSIHSLPLARRDVDDIDILETAPPTGKGVIRSNFPTDGQARSQAAPVEAPTSRSSSNYYSPPSGSLQSPSKARVTGNESATSSTEKTGTFGRADPTPGFTRAKRNLVKEGTVGDGPITPTSDASRNRQPKLAAHEPNHTATNGVGPPSRTSSFSYKFRREDRAQSIESEIDDTQMSPRSRRSLKRPRNARHSDTASRAVSVKELSRLFDHVDERRPLIQESKRQRKETKWDFSEHVEGLSETGDEHASPEKDQNQDDPRQSTGSNSSESDEAEDMAAQRSKSHALSDATTKDSNASTERPMMYASANALRLSQTAQPQALSQGAVSNTMAENDSDKENANHEQSMYHQSPPLDQRRDVNGAAQGSSKAVEKEHFKEGNKGDIEKSADGAAVGMLNLVNTTNSDTLTKSSVRSSRALPDEVSEQLNSSSSHAVHASPKKSRSRKKKSRLEEEEETPKPDNRLPKTHTDVEAMTSNASAKADREMLTSIAKSNIGDRAVPMNEPDEQLSQDLQASAQAGNNKLTTIPKPGEVSGRKQYAWLKKSAGEPSSKPHRGKPDLDQDLSIIDQEQRKPSGSVKKRGPSDIKVETVGLSSYALVGSVDKEKSKDGKLGLGFSQSPPSKNRAPLRPNVSYDNLDHKGQNEKSEILPNGKGDISFLKKSRSFDKVMSSQSWGADTPSRSAQPGANTDPKSGHIDVDVPGRKSNAPGALAEAIGGVPVQTITSSSESESESEPDDEVSSSEGGETSKVAQRTVKDGTKCVSADAAVPSIEIASGSSDSESEAVLPPSKAATKASTPSKDRPTIISKGNNLYNINGTSIVVPPGFTLDAYLAMRSDFANQPPKANPRNRIAASGKSATPTLNRQDSSATPVPVAVKVAPKSAVSKPNNKQQVNTTKRKDAKQMSSAPPPAKTGVKQPPHASKTKDSTRPSFRTTTKTSHVAEVPAAPKTQSTTKPSGSARSRPVGPASTSSRPVAPPSVKPNGLGHLAPAKPPATIKEYKAKLDADRAKMTAASSSKTSGMTTPNLVNSTNFLGEDSESDSESETESEASSSDKQFEASKGRPTPAKTPATGIATVDLSIRDPSPSSDEEEL